MFKIQTFTFFLADIFAYSSQKGQSTHTRWHLITSQRTGPKSWMASIHWHVQFSLLQVVCAKQLSTCLALIQSLKLRHSLFLTSFPKTIVKARVQSRAKEVQVCFLHFLFSLEQLTVQKALNMAQCGAKKIHYRLQRLFHKYLVTNESIIRLIWCHPLPYFFNFWKENLLLPWRCILFTMIFHFVRRVLN